MSRTGQLAEMGTAEEEKDLWGRVAKKKDEPQQYFYVFQKVKQAQLYPELPQRELSKPSLPAGSVARRNWVKENKKGYTEKRRGTTKR